MLHSRTLSRLQLSSCGFGCSLGTVADRCLAAPRRPQRCCPASSFSRVLSSGAGKSNPGGVDGPPGHESSSLALIHRQEAGHIVMSAQDRSTSRFRIDFAIARSSVPARIVAFLSGLARKSQREPRRNSQWEQGRGFDGHRRKQAARPPPVR